MSLLLHPSKIAAVIDDTPSRLNELPALHDLGEPGVELLVGGDLVQKAAVNEPHLAGVAHDGVVAVEHGRLGAVDHDIGRVLHDARGLVEFEFLVGDSGAKKGGVERMVESATAPGVVREGTRYSYF